MKTTCKSAFFALSILALVSACSSSKTTEETKVSSDSTTMTMPDSTAKMSTDSASMMSPDSASTSATSPASTTPGSMTK